MSSLWIRKKKSLICFLKESCLKGVQLFPHGDDFPEHLGACGKQLLGASLHSSFYTKMDNFNLNCSPRSVTNRYKTGQEVREGASKQLIPI